MKTKLVISCILSLFLLSACGSAKPDTIPVASPVSVDQTNVPVESSGSKAVSDTVKKLLDKQRTLTANLSKTDLQKYWETQKQLSDIKVAKELWSPELVASDAEIREFIMNTVTGSTVKTNLRDNPKYQELIAKKSNLLKEFLQSPAYLEYQANHIVNINNLNVEMKK